MKKIPFYTTLKNWVTLRKLKSSLSKSEKKELTKWEKDGRPAPPPHFIKQETIRSFKNKFKLKILVETGTYYGDMIEAMKNDFSQIYSIELSEDLYQKAKQRFFDTKHISIIQGDSGVQLEKLVKTINQPVLFWLDGHYSAGVTARGDKDTPIYEELNHIFNSNHEKYIIVIDDARCFGNDPDYPSIKELSDFVNAKLPNAKIEVKDDSIRVIPPYFL